MPLNTDLLTSHKPLLLMLDYDGTLTPIVPDYTQAVLPPQGPELLHRLAHIPKLQLAVVSGRSVEQLLGFLSRLQGDPVYLVGLHGGEVYDLSQGRFLQAPSEAYQADIAHVKSYLYEHHIHYLPGIAIEDKGYSLAVHYRQADEESSRLALDCLAEAMNLEALQMSFVLRPGKKLLEAVPKGFNKGAGVQELIVITQKRFGRLPDLAYIGDDITDFDAFEVVLAHQGFAAYVGKHLPEKAPPVTACLPDIHAVYRLLDTLLEVKISP